MHNLIYLLSLNYGSGSNKTIVFHYCDMELAWLPWPFSPPPLTLGIRTGYRWHLIIELVASLSPACLATPLYIALNHRRNGHLPSLIQHNQWWLQRSGQPRPIVCHPWRVEICSHSPFRSYQQGHVANCYVPIWYHSGSVLFSTRRKGDNILYKCVLISQFLIGEKVIPASDKL
jgi:hypothetical protein